MWVVGCDSFMALSPRMQVPECTLAAKERLCHNSHWKIWKTIENLTTSERSCDYQQTLTDRVIHILHQWATEYTVDSQWQSFFNKKSFQHEVEESMVALFHLDQWRRQAKCNGMKFVCVDVCGGKGMFSLLLQHYAAQYWKSGKGATLECIILLERATNDRINWSHLVTGSTINNKYVPIVLWDGVDLLDRESILMKLNDWDCSIALSGIHLCKLLSPAMISLANQLGSRCVYLCVAPCCLPRAVRSKRMGSDSRIIVVFRYEEEEKRHKRLILRERRNRARRRARSAGSCYLCKTPDHWLKHCPNLPRDPGEQSRLLQEACASTGCWKCGDIGHCQVECCQPAIQEQSLEPPSLKINVAHVMNQTDVLQSYCAVLASTIEGCSSGYPVVYESGLSNNSAVHQGNNWNSDRKSIFIVAHK